MRKPPEKPLEDSFCPILANSFRSEESRYNIDGMVSDVGLLSRVVDVAPRQARCEFRKFQNKFDTIVPGMHEIDLCGMRNGEDVNIFLHVVLLEEYVCVARIGKNGFETVYAKGKREPDVDCLNDAKAMALAYLTIVMGIGQSDEYLESLRARLFEEMKAEHANSFGIVPQEAVCARFGWLAKRLAPKELPKILAKKKAKKSAVEKLPDEAKENMFKRSLQEQYSERKALLLELPPDVIGCLKFAGRELNSLDIGNEPATPNATIQGYTPRTQYRDFSPKEKKAEMFENLKMMFVQQEKDEKKRELVADFVLIMRKAKDMETAERRSGFVGKKLGALWEKYSTITETENRTANSTNNSLSKRASTLPWR